MDERQDFLENILDHYDQPRNKSTIPDPTIRFTGGNPGCGDEVTVSLRIEHDVIQEISFEGHGCTLSQAGASLATELVANRAVDDVLAMTRQDVDAEFGERAVSSRPACATLGLTTIQKAIHEWKLTRPA